MCIYDIVLVERFVLALLNKVNIIIIIIIISDYVWQNIFY